MLGLVLSLLRDDLRLVGDEPSLRPLTTGAGVPLCRIDPSASSVMHEG